MQTSEIPLDINGFGIDTEKLNKELDYFKEKMAEATKIPKSRFDDRLKTKGGIIVEEIQVGDIHYEFEYGCGLECKVLTKPVKDENNQWRWESENVRKPGHIIKYLITEGYGHYGPNLYSYKAYRGEGINWM